MDIFAIIEQILTLILGIISIIFSPQINHPNKYNGTCTEGFLGENCEIECGVSYFKPNVKIVGGLNAFPNSWPAHVYVETTYENYYYFEDLNISKPISVSFSCGGTLIDKSTILTASHCIFSSFDQTINGTTYILPIELNDKYPTYESMLTVNLGIHDLSDIGSNNNNNNNNNISPVVKMKVSRIIKHEKYNESNFLNDIAILKLAQPVTLNSYVQVACLPKNKPSSFPSYNQPSYSVGWGTTAEGGEVSDLLKNTKLTIYNDTICNNVLPGYSKNWTTQICSGDLNGQTDTCQGDSGGPLYVLDTIGGREKYVLAGIVSYGDGCARPNKSGIYTRTVAYLDWIKQNS